jgi:hypothetical protein
MSIDLGVRLRNPISLRPLLLKIENALVEMLGLESAPTVTLECLENGQRLPPPHDTLSDHASPFFLISIVGEPECVGLSTASGDWATVTMAAQRTNLEYALGAATAIVLSRSMSERISDDWRFFSNAVDISPEDLIQVLRVPGPNTDWRFAAEQLEGRIDRAD